jgi:hypothetical protein
MPFIAVGMHSRTGEHVDVQPIDGVEVQIVRQSEVSIDTHCSSSPVGGPSAPQKRQGIRKGHGPEHHMSQ